MIPQGAQKGIDPRERDRDVSQFIVCVYSCLPPDDVVEVRCLRKRGEKTETKQYWEPASCLIDVLDNLSALNRDGWNVYIGANPRPKAKATGDKCIDLARTLFVDFDGGCTVEEARRRLKSAGLPEPTLIVFSGHGVHCYWSLVEPLYDLSKWTAMQKRLIALLGSDKAIHNPERIMRLPGFLNVKAEPHVRCNVVDADPARVYELAHIEAVLPTPASSNGNGALHADEDELVRRARKYLTTIPNASAGERNTAAYRVGAVLVNDYKLPEVVAMPLFAEWNAGNNPPLDDAELTAVLKSGGKYASKPPGCKAEAKLTKTKKKKPVAVIEAPRRFPVDALPEVVRQFVVQAADAIGCDRSFIGLPMLGCLARAIGNNRVIRLKSTWCEPAIVWLAIVGKSGSHKSPAIKTTMATLQRKQAEAIEQHKAALEHYAEEVAQYERDYGQWKRSKTTDPPPWEPKAPVCQRFIVGDITIEALADRLDGQFDGVLLVRDELAGWVNGIAEYKGGKGSDTGHWLATWSGEPMTVDRKTGAKKMLHVPRAAVSIIGGIQPGILRQAIGREHMQDGLCARLLLAMPETKPVSWTDDVVGPSTYKAMDDLLERMLAMEPAADADGRPEPFPLSLTPAAKCVWIRYYDRHRHEQVDLSDDLAAAWSKLEAYSARFALIFQLCRDPASIAVDEQSVVDAITLSEWFGHEARRVYGMLVEDDEDREHRELVGFIRRRGGQVTPRDLMRGGPCFRTSEEAEAELNKLAANGDGAWHFDNETGGRSRNVFQLTDTTDTDANRVKTAKENPSVSVSEDNEVDEWTG